MTIKIDKEFSTLLRKLDEEEYALLQNSVVEDGCRDPLVIWEEENILLDGHNRKIICEENELEYDLIYLSFSNREDAYDWIIDNQLGKRNAANEYKSYLRGKRYNAEKKRHGGDRKSNRHSDDLIEEGKTVDTLADNYSVSPKTIERDGQFAKALDDITNLFIDTKEAEELGSDIKDSVLSGKSKLTKKDITSLGKHITDNPEKIKAVVEKVYNDDENVKSAISQLNKVRPPQLTGKYHVIYADPPWQYDFSKSSTRDIENQYPTMTLDEICKLNVDSIAGDDCVLFLWTTSPKLEESFRVIKEWGFIYKTCAVWSKDKIGMGYWFRQQHELLLVATKGSPSPPEPANRVSSVIVAPRTKHSVKPETVYDIIEKINPDYKCIELFCRTPREGWSIWGNELMKDDKNGTT